ncbi:hypothetical protein CERZMDRAFT_113151 [Cercospora zeae-maydis SCOH1-5]|uniref:Hydrophobin n=1 Tax=Cercospora zeae-maydis SCOH1-5 TaxID=717836 RepID=A0A6A6FAX9_9PEZI|nr:hypothetical protein CERZMDRAFT_113151 [Cercospora zeae-maydis SCOH1-5]
MQYSTIFSVIASVAVVAAMPQAAISSQCGAGNAVSCCNTAGDSGLATAIIAGSCSIQIPVIAAAIGNSCNAGNTFCCPMEQGSVSNSNRGDCYIFLTISQSVLNAGLPCVPVNVN